MKREHTASPGGICWSGFEWRSGPVVHRDFLAFPQAHNPPPPNPLPRDENLVRCLPRESFAGNDAQGRALEPRTGRFYPPRFLIASQRASLPNTPFRVLSADETNICIDANDALADVELKSISECWPAPIGISPTRFQTGPVSPFERLIQAGCGFQRFQSVRAAGEPEFCKLSEGARADPGPDRDFYRRPRLVHHIDANARWALAECHRRHLNAAGISSDAPVLDLMSGWDTHLADESTFQVTGLGLNEAELAANPRLAHRVVADLNALPVLPFPDAAFSAALCALSVEYLIDPVAVFRDVARVLKPGGCLIVTWSERWFPPKAIALWSELHPYERVAWVVDRLLQAGLGSDLITESRRGLARPADDRYAARLPESDPLYLVVAKLR